MIAHCALIMGGTERRESAMRHLTPYCHREQSANQCLNGGPKLINRWAFHFKRFFGDLPMNPEDLLTLVTTAMPFGKHKGVLLADLPGNYLTWFAREGFPKGDIGRLLAQMHEIDHNGLSDLLRPLRGHRP
jgi:uncharacterized protein (DUF3820 family)